MRFRIIKAKRLLVFVTFLFWGTIPILAYNLDSTKQKLPYLRNEQLVDTYLEVARFSFEMNSNIADLILYSNKGLNKAKEISYIPGVINSLTYLGIGYSMKGDVETSNKYWQQGLKLATWAKDYVSVADLESKLGYNYDNASNYQLALEHYFKAAAMMEDLGNYIGLTITYDNIAGIFGTQKQTEECLFYLRKSLSLVKKLKDPHDKMMVYSSVSLEMLAIAETDSTYLDSALVYALLGLPIALENKFHQKTGTFYLQLSRIMSLKGNEENANEYFKEAAKYRGYISGHILLLYYLRATDHHLNKKNNQIALKYIDSTYAQLESTNNEFYGAEISKRSYEINEQLGNYKYALDAHKKLRHHEQNIFNDQRIRQVNLLQQKFNKVQNEKKIEQLDREAQLLNKNRQIDQLKINMLAIGTILLLAIVCIIIFIYRQKRIQQKKIILETELRLSRSRINPHFFFNAMAALQSQALNENDNTKIALYLSKYAKIMRLTLEGSYNNMVNIESELDFIVQYMDIQKLRTKNKFDYIINVEEESNIYLLKVPSMILQPFIENSIEHGFANINYRGEITISVAEKNNYLEIIIDDNGMGGSNERHIKDFPSRATSIITDRLFLLSKKIKKQASFEMTKKQKENGFIVILHLPIIES